MGGSALTKGLTERKSAKDYLRIKETVVGRLRKDGIGQIEIAEIIEMPLKESFGDLDLLFMRQASVTHDEVHSLIELLFSPKEIVKCGSVFSFDFERFQIDLIECEVSFAMSNFCLNYGDRGMILGQMARWKGFALGVHGLAIAKSDVERIVGIKGASENKIVLSSDPVAIRLYMGLPADDSSLHTPTDVAEFCKESSWFLPEQFTRKLNADGRKRMAKRPFYRSFVEQLGMEAGIDVASLDSKNDAALEMADATAVLKEDQNRYREANIEDGLTRFDKWGEVAAIRQRHQDHMVVHEKLNYKHFIELGIKNCDLTKARFNFNCWLANNNEDMENVFVGCSSSAVAWDCVNETDACATADKIVLHLSKDVVEERLATWYRQFEAESVTCS